MTDSPPATTVRRTNSRRTVLSALVPATQRSVWAAGRIRRPAPAFGSLPPCGRGGCPG